MSTKPLFHIFYHFCLFTAAVFFVCCAICCFAATTELPIAWETDFDQASIRAKNINRLLFVHFYGENCPPCKLMESNVFTNPQVIAQMNRDFVPLKINVTDQPLLAKRFSVKAIPTDIILSPDGQLVHRRQGGITTDRFAEYLVYLLNTLQKETVKQIPTPVLNQQPPEPLTAPMVSQTPIPIPTPQPPEQPNVIRDPFTKQPVVSQPVVTPPNPAAPIAQTQPIPGQIPASLALPELINTVRIEEKPNSVPNLAAAPITTPPTVPPAVSPLTLNCPVFTPPNFSVGAPSNSDENATTMVEVPLGLEGYCPVILSTEERWIPGNPAYYTMYRGHVFRFSSEETMTEFMKEPSKFAPVAMGEDIVQMVDRNKKIYGNRKFGAWFQGRVYLFCNQESLDAFANRPEYYAEIALKYETAFKGTLGRF